MRAHKRARVALVFSFEAVRKASVRSISLLAKDRGSFASKALDFLADMFNDEIEEVRLDAINGLRPLIQYSLLTEDQMEVILNVLDVSLPFLVFSVSCPSASNF